VLFCRSKFKGKILSASDQKRQVLVNASNIHKGGAVQVAVSFLYDLIHGDRDTFTYEIEASTVVSKNLEKMGVNTKKILNFKEKNRYGFWAVLRNSFNSASKHKIIFNVFGPHYALLERRYQITGFAQAWIVDYSAYSSIGPLTAIKSKLKYRIQKFFFSRADRLIVELPHVKQGLINKNIQNPSKIDVVYNCVSTIYNHPNKWTALEGISDTTAIKIGYVGKDYAHKNLDSLPIVQRILKQKYNMNVIFYVTLAEEEWLQRKESFSNHVENVGELDVTQCPTFYEKLDGVIFPSLLESFSATPIEALFMKRPLFASDRHFVRDICSINAIYFDPLNPHDIAKKINSYFQMPKQKQRQFVSAGYAHVMSLPTSQDRSESYIDIIIESLNEIGVNK
jgi:glycosyltransferase involved in cell wall biosynthesis